MFRYLDSRGIAVPVLSESFWVRMDAVFNGRSHDRLVDCLSGLLRHENGQR
jgi:hypothetical protein